MAVWVGIAGRIVGAIGGGYGLACLVAAFCTVVWPGSRVEAVVAGMLLGLLAHAGCAMWMFAARTAMRAWGVMMVPAVVLGGLTWLLRGGP